MRSAWTHLIVPRAIHREYFRDMWIMLKNGQIPLSHSRRDFRLWESPSQSIENGRSDQEVTDIIVSQNEDAPGLFWKVPAPSDRAASYVQQTIDDDPFPRHSR